MLHVIKGMLATEARPKKVVDSLLARFSELENRNFPYRDSHQFIDDATMFLSGRNPVKGFTRIDEDVLFVARATLSPSEVRSLDAKAEVLSQKNASNYRKKLSDFRQELLEAIEREKSKNPMRFDEKIAGAKRRAAERIKEIKAEQSAIAETPYTEISYARSQELDRELRIENRRLTGLEQQIDTENDKRNWRRFFYERAEENQIPIRGASRPTDNFDLSGAGFTLELDHGVVIPSTGLISIRALNESVLFEVPTITIAGRRPVVVDLVDAGASGARGHDIVHARVVPQTAWALIRLGVADKRRILNGIDALPTARLRDLANTGHHMTLHENVRKAYARPDDYELWAKELRENARIEISPAEHKWLVKWMRDLHERFGVEGSFR